MFRLASRRPDSTPAGPVWQTFGRRAFAGVVAGVVAAGWSSGAELRVMTWNVENGVGSPGSPAFAAVRETLARLRPDVIAFQEIDAQSADPGRPEHFADLRALLDAAGFPTDRDHLATTGDAFRSQVLVAGDFGNSSQCLAVASRHPVRRVVQIGRGVAGRRELTRYPLAVTIDVPGVAEALTIVAVHGKQGDTQADEFRRGVEAYRVREFLATEGLSGATHPIVVLGDMNDELNEPQTSSFSTAGIAGGHVFGDGSALPSAYGLGSGVPDPLPYAVFPTSGFAGAGLSVVPATQTDGASDRTYALAGNARLDYILTGPAIRAAGAVRAEVYHSGREPVGDGLPKASSLPDAGLSLAASDHLPVVADLMLVPVPSLALALPATAIPVAFEPPAAPAEGRVSISAPRPDPLVVTIAPFRNAPLRRIPPVVIPAGQTSAVFPLEVAGSPFTPDRRVTLVARADGYRPGLGILPIQGPGVAGPVLISQYTEAPTGSSPKAIEIMNVGARAIDFAAEPLQVLFFPSGAATGRQEILAEAGRLPAGAVVVVGDTATAQHLIDQGLLTVPAAAVADAETGTVFTDTGRPEGRAVFIKRGFLFNGDDALEVRLNARRCDVFGRIGQDPGTAWSAAGVATANQNLSRRRTAIAASAGWTNPGLAFETTGTSPATALLGFGLPPVLDDPYADWAAARGLTGPDAALAADPDGNGVANGLEFVFGSNGPVLESLPSATGGREWRLGPMVRARPGSLRWGLATAGPDGSWSARWEETAALDAPDEAFRPLSLVFPADGPAGLARVFVIRP